MEVLFSEEYVTPVSISVRENRIVAVDYVVKHRVPFAIDYQIIEGLFDLLQEGIDKNVHSISAEYHSELGYPIDVWIDYEIGAIDDEIGFEINGLLIK